MGEGPADQKDTKATIKDAIKESAAEGDDDWGLDIDIAKDRPESVLNKRVKLSAMVPPGERVESIAPELLAFSAMMANVFCATGAGGGVDATCSPAGGGLGGDKAKFVGKKVTRVDQLHAAKIEIDVADALGAKVQFEVLGDRKKYQRDKAPYDAKVGNNAVEIKSLLKGKKTSISVHPDALMRKVDYVADNPGTQFHTVVVDERETYEGGKNAGRYSGHRMYYSRGCGRFSLSQMHPVKSMAELNRLVRMSDAELPEAAKGSFPPPPSVRELRKAAAKAKKSRDAKDKRRKAEQKALREES